MFVIAGLPVPMELAAAGPTSPWDVREILRVAVRMGPQQHKRLAELIASQQVLPRTEPVSTDDYPDGPGALLLRLLRNRNIRPYLRSGLWRLGGPIVSASTVAGLGSARTIVTPQFVTAFAHLLGYTPDDMVALTGVGPAFEDGYVHPASAEIAALAWDARLLSSEQIRDVVAAAQERPANASDQPNKTQIGEIDDTEVVVAERPRARRSKFFARVFSRVRQ